MCRSTDYIIYICIDLYRYIYIYICTYVCIFSLKKPWGSAVSDLIRTFLGSSVEGIGSGFQAYGLKLHAALQSLGPVLGFLTGIYEGFYKGTIREVERALLGSFVKGLHWGCHPCPAKLSTTILKHSNPKAVSPKL